MATDPARYIAETLQPERYSTERDNWLWSWTWASDGINKRDVLVNLFDLNNLFRLLAELKVVEALDEEHLGTPDTRYPPYYKDEVSNIFGDFIAAHHDPARFVTETLKIMATALGWKEKNSFCETCGVKPGTPRSDNSLPCGVHCDECFDSMIHKCRSRSW